MIRIRCIIAALCIVTSHAQAQVTPPQPPLTPQTKITRLECDQWKQAIAGGYTLNALEQNRYSQCDYDEPTGRGLAPAAETYVPGLEGRGV
jgi:hypothetical protein